MISWILLPLAGAFIGWMTNLLAVRMIFRPREPRRIPLLGLTIQGLLPKRQADLARSIAQVVERDLLPMDELLALVGVDRYQEAILDQVLAQVDQRVAASWPRYLPQALREAVAGYLRAAVARETAMMLDQLGARLSEDLRERVKLAPLVERQVAQLPTDQLEQLVWRVVGQEFRWIEYLGAILGGLLGLGQAALLAVVG
ncbi:MULTISPECIES: DUF445 domain-containing protein [Limnochorda]|uniref:DUF445 domain-containing protein n=1 Tax=Limnochorda TaxID=1676651 RepID=UPI001792DA27|nr:DUF445 family protein [Limnochorda pilosa]MBO2487098.1 DUF445 domain-containing protein [Bacillota bacterium]MBO2519890.1 DUF445 domain-containing protein [Bacillota bacterium]NMA72354.1 DUF445 family protein [Bacillota bacterium]